MLSIGSYYRDLRRQDFLYEESAPLLVFKWLFLIIINFLKSYIIKLS